MDGLRRKVLTYWPIRWTGLQQQVIPLALHVGQVQLSVEAGMQNAHTRDCIDIYRDTQTCCHFRNTAKSYAHPSSKPGIVDSLLDSVTP